VDDRAAGMRIKVTDGGPYLVSGGVPLVRVRIVTDEAGESAAWEEYERLEVGERYALCRCGTSSRKPFCDGSHMDCVWDSAETAGHDSFAEAAIDIDGPGVLLHDARRLCAEARFCARGAKLWNLVKSCDSPEDRALAEEEASLCPSGRYVICADGVELEPEFEPSIALIDDPAMGVAGPLWVRGGIEIVDAEGEPYEIRNRVTLCRCGKSANKPFCDGSHIESGFRE